MKRQITFCQDFFRKDKEERAALFAHLTTYYANRKRAKKTRPRREVEGASPDDSTSSKKARRDYLMSYEAVADIVRRSNEGESKCCDDDCLNSKFTPQTIRARRVRIHSMGQVSRCNFMVNEISGFQIVESAR